MLPMFAADVDGTRHSTTLALESALALAFAFAGREREYGSGAGVGGGGGVGGIGDLVKHSGPMKFP